MKTKLFSLFLALVASVGTMFAERVQIGDLYYNLDATNQTAELTYQEQWSENNYSGLTSANIPSSVTYNEAIYSVTNIGNYAFSDCTGLTSIEIPNSVTSIGEYAFYNCSGLTSIEIPNSVTSIEIDAFRNCSALTSIEISNNVTSLGKYAFSGCTGLTSVTLNSDSIVGASYSYYSNIGSFFGLQVKEYIIGENVKSIGKNAFSGCTGLTSITIPNSVTSIGESAFSGCTGLTSPLYNEHVFAYMPTSYSNAYTIPDGIESIAVGAFSGCTGLTSITIPNSVTSIGEYAFNNCSDLTSVAIPSSVADIGKYAFYNCTGLTSIEIPNSVTSIGEYTFSNCSGLTSIEIPNSVTNIGESAFKGCTGLTSVEIPNSVKSVGIRAFYDCYNLSSVNIPNSVISIGSSAFGGVQNINYTGTASGLPWGAKRLNGERIYSVSEIKDIASRLSSGQTSDDYYRFTGVISSIENVNTTYGNATFNIRDEAITINTFYCYRIYDYHSTMFTSNDQLKVGDIVVISSKVKNQNGTTPEAIQGRLVYHSANPLFTPDSIFYYGHRKNYPGELKLYEAIDIDTLDIPSAVSYNGQNYTVTEMASGAFYNKSNLKCIKLPKTLKLMSRAFEKCSNIQSLYFNAKNLEQQTTIPFAESSTTLRTIHIGENVSSLPHEFFNNLTNITTVYWNAIACYDMHYSPFYYSRNSITDFIIANNIEYIPANMCWGMTNLTEFKIPSSVTAIGKDAFHGCTSLTSLSLGENITSYGDSVFAGCSALTSIYNYRKRPAKLSTGTFDGVDYFNCTLYVLAGSENMYKSSGSDWKDFYFVQPIGATEITADKLIVTPSETTADVIWPVIEGAHSYELVIKDKSGNIICTLYFNANGQLTSIAFRAPTRDTSEQKQSQGFSFTITGLEYGKTYDLILTSKDEKGLTLDQKMLSFTTGGEQVIAGIITPLYESETTNKLLRDGQILILRGDRTYTLTGQEVK